MCTKPVDITILILRKIVAPLGRGTICSLKFFCVRERACGGIFFQRVFVVVSLATSRRVVIKFLLLLDYLFRLIFCIWLFRVVLVFFFFATFFVFGIVLFDFVPCASFPFLSSSLFVSLCLSSL